MKKIILLFAIIFVLFGCSNKYVSLGYSKEAAKVIEGLKDSKLFDTYSDKLESLLTNSDFDASKLDIYEEFIDSLDVDSLIKLAKDNITSENIELVKKLIGNSNFDIDRLNEYLDVSDDIDDVDTVIEVVNNGLGDFVLLIKAYMADPYYIADNLPLYIKYRRDDTIRNQVQYVNTLGYLTYFDDGMYAEPDKYGVEMNVNKYYYLGETYNPDDIESLTSSEGYGSLRKVAHEAYAKMQEAASLDGVDFYATSSYRSYDTQVKIYNSYLVNDPQEVVDTYSARPGFSDHQTGLTVDILSGGYDFGNFYASTASDWLAKNAYKYGFICRYPDSLTDATGYTYEPWHYRYVGDIAQDVYEKGISYDEYFEKYIKER